MAVRGRVGVAGVEHARGKDDGLEEVLHDGGGHGGVVLDGGEFAVGCRGEADAVDGGGTASDRAEHLRTSERELHGLLHDAGGHGAEDDVRPGGALGAETAADEWVHDVHVFGREAEGVGER